MSIRNTIPATKARKQFFKILKAVEKPDNPFIITKGGIPQAVIMSAEDFDSLQETLEIMSDRKVMRDLVRAERDFKKGKFYKFA